MNKDCKELEKVGIRIQKSFFICDFSYAEKEEIKEGIIRNMDLKVDKLSIYSICDKCMKKIIYIGRDESFMSPEFLVL
ncbi:MAG: CRISPR-associated endonuclease Cas2 [Bacilli bacterium]